MFSASLQVALEELDKVRGVQKGEVSSLREAIATAQPTSAAENLHKLQAYVAKQPLMGQDSSYGAKLEAACVSKQPAASRTNPPVPEAPTGGPRALRHPISQHSQPSAPKVRSGMCQQQAPEAALADSVDPCDPAAMELSDPQLGHRVKAPQRVLRSHDKQAFEVIPGTRPPREASGEPGRDHSYSQPDHCTTSQRVPRTCKKRGAEEISGIGPAREDSGDVIMQASAAVATVDSLIGSLPICKARRMSSHAHAGMPEQLVASQPGLCALAEASHLIQAPAPAQHVSAATVSPSQKQHASPQQGLWGHKTYAQEAAASSAVEGSGGPQMKVSAALAALDSLTGDLNPSTAKSSPLPADKGDAQDGLCLDKEKQPNSGTETKNPWPMKGSAPDLRRHATLGGSGAKAEHALPAGKGKSRPPYAQGVQHRKPTQAQRCAQRDEQLQEEAEFSDSCPMAVAAPKLNHKATTRSQWDEKEPQRPGKGKSRPPYPQGVLKGHTAEVYGRVGAHEQPIHQVMPYSGAKPEARAATAAAPGTKAPGKDKSELPLPRALSSKQGPGALAGVHFRKRICRAPCPKAVPGKQQGAAQGKPRFHQQHNILSPVNAKGAVKAASKGMVHPQKEQQGLTSDSTADTAAGETSSAIAAKARLQKWKERQGLMRGTVTCPSAPSGTAAPAATRAFASAPAPAAADTTTVGGNMSQNRPPYAEALLAVPRRIGQKDKHSNEASSCPFNGCTMAYLDV